MPHTEHLKPGLYIVSTPIGNLSDMSFRAIEVLSQVDTVLAEDTRVTQKLLNHYSINVPLVAHHQHNEHHKAAALVERIQSGKALALVSDAGTPLISDPGYSLVNAVLAAGQYVTAIPGANAVTQALVMSGLSANEFAFYGFVPVKNAAKQTWFERIQKSYMTAVMYESRHRIANTVTWMQANLPEDQPVVIARELTKMFEECYRGPVGGMMEWLEAHSARHKGEFVLLMGSLQDDEEAGSDIGQQVHSIETDALLKTLLAELPSKQAASIASQLTGLKKNECYKRCLQLSE